GRRRVEGQRGERRRGAAGRAARRVSARARETVTQVDFYITGENAADARLKLVCTLCDDAMQRDQHVFVNVTSERDARQLDELLWTFIQGSFIPHCVVERPIPDVPREPAIIC